MQAAGLKHRDARRTECEACLDGMDVPIDPDGPVLCGPCGRRNRMSRLELLAELRERDRLDGRRGVCPPLGGW